MSITFFIFVILKNSFPGRFQQRDLQLYRSAFPMLPAVNSAFRTPLRRFSEEASFSISHPRPRIMIISAQIS